MVRIAAAGGIVGWLALVGAGVASLTIHARTPGAAASNPRHWPAGSVLARNPDRMALLVFLHPRCPCSRATLGELNRLLAQAPRAGVQTWIVLREPENSTWNDPDGLAVLAETAGVEVHRDRGGRETRRFGAETSGTVLLYDHSGRARFAGGITPARAHEGDNQGRTAAQAVLLGQPENGAASGAPVYGCPLFSSTTPTPR